MLLRLLRRRRPPRCPALQDASKADMPSHTINTVLLPCVPKNGKRFMGQMNRIDCASIECGPNAIAFECNSGAAGTHKCWDTWSVCKLGLEPLTRRGSRQVWTTGTGARVKTRRLQNFGPSRAACVLGSIPGQVRPRCGHAGGPENVREYGTRASDTRPST